MKKLLKTTILLIIIILFTGCTVNINKNQEIKNKSNKNTDTIIKEINDVDKNLQYELPLGIDSVKLMSSGKAILITSNSNIPNEEVTVSLNVKDIYILPFGNGGYRSIIFLKNDGTVSIVNASALIENKKIEVLDNIGGYTNVVSIEQEKDSSGSLINVVLESGEKYLLDGYIK